MKDPCLVSVILPVYNAARYLRESLDSLTRQTLSDIEIICVNDGSEDDSLRILEEYAAKDSRIRILSQPNGGAGVARNSGLNAAQGTYIFMPDADDFYHPKLLQYAVRMAESENADIVIFKARSYHTKTRRYRRMPWAFQVAGISSNVISAHDMPNRIFTAFQNWVWNKLFRRSFLESKNIRFQPLKRTNDLLFTCKALTLAGRIALLNRSLANYRIGVETSSQATNHMTPLDFYTAMIAFKIWLEESGHFDEYQLSFYNMALNGSIYNLRSIKEWNAFERLYLFLQATGFEALGLENLKPNDATKKDSYYLYREITNYTPTDFLFRRYRNQNEQLSGAANRRWYTRYTRKVKEIAKKARQYYRRYGFRAFWNKVLNRIGVAKERPLDTRLPMQTASISLFNASITVHLIGTKATLSFVSLTARRILRTIDQKVRLALWFSKTEFEGRIRSLPNAIRHLSKKGAAICWYDSDDAFAQAALSSAEDVRIILPCDADNPVSAINRLIDAYRINPHLAHCNAVIPIHFAGPGRVEIAKERDAQDQAPSYLNVPDFSAGCLFPPHSLPGTDRSAFLSSLPSSIRADVRFWAACVKAGVKFNLTESLPDSSCGQETPQREVFSEKDRPDAETMLHQLSLVISQDAALQETLLQEQAELDRLSIAMKTPQDRKDYAYCKSLSPDLYRAELTLWYRSITGRRIDLDHPKTFSEKTQWMKLYDSTREKSLLADKYSVRDWVAEKIGNEYLIPLLGVWDRFEDIDFDTLPERFVLKCTHGSGWNVLVRSKSHMDVAAVKAKIDRWLSMDYSAANGFELHYRGIPPRVIAETYLGEVGSIPDYKILCFNGVPAVAWVDSDRFIEHRRDVFDVSWKPAPFRIAAYKPAIIPPKKPARLDEMLRLAGVLSEGFRMARIDLYEVDGALYFGEITFTSESGRAKITPYEYDCKLGELLVLPFEKRPPKTGV